MPEQEADYSEVQGTSAAIAGGGGTGNLEIALSDLPDGLALVRIHEVILDSESIDFDAAIHEDAARTRLNRIFNTLTINQHTVQLIGAGRGVQYLDREVATPADTADLHWAFVNRDAGAQTITARVRYSISIYR